MPHPKAKRKVKVSTKLALGIIVVVAIVALLFYSPDGISIPGVGNVELGLPDIFGGQEVGGDKLTFVMTSDQSILKDKISLKEAKVTVSGTHRIPTSLGQVVFDNADKEAEVTFNGFDGTVTTTANILSATGTALNAVSDGTTIKPKTDEFDVEVSLQPSSYTITPITVRDLELTSVSGSIEKLGKESSTVKLTGSTVNIKGFQGALTFDGSQYKLTGTASMIEGESFVLTS